jgi:hypothetical protein
MARVAVISFRVRAMARVASTSSITHGPAITTRGLFPPREILFMVTVLVKGDPLYYMLIIPAKNE